MDGVLDFKFYDQAPLLKPELAQWMDGCLGVSQLTFSSLDFLVCVQQAFGILSIIGGGGEDMPGTEPAYYLRIPVSSVFGLRYI